MSLAAPVAQRYPSSGDSPSSPSTSYHGSTHLRSSTQSNDLPDAQTPDSSRPSSEYRDKVMNASARRNSPSSGADAPLDRHGSLKVNKTRRKGGFLLQNVFHKSRKSDDRERAEEREPEPNRDVKGKRKLQDFSTTMSENSLVPGHNAARGSYDESPLANVSILHAKGRDDRRGHTDPSSEWKRHSSPSTSHMEPRNMRSSLDFSASSASHDAPTATIDPTTIVNMALNLSENRRRNISGGQYLAPGVASGRRNVTPGVQVPPTIVTKHLQQRHASRDKSPSSGRRAASGRLDAPVAADVARTPVNQEFGQPLQISAATLARADRARRYIELGTEYRRVLAYLPPLAPAHAAPGNVIVQTVSVPGSPQVMLQRIPTGLNETHELGRMYNPLQMIRNRKLRARTRNPLRPDIEDWDDTIKVSEWVDSVAQAAKDPKFREEERASLPGYPPDVVPLSTTLNPPPQQASILRGKKPRYDWQFTPAELLADAYWLEQNHNKDLIEDSHGRLVFPSRAGSIGPRKSFESRKSFTESIQGSIRRHSRDGSEPPIRNSIDKNRNSLDVPRRSHDERHGRVRHAINRARGRRDSSTSDLSVSDHDETSSLPKKRSSVHLSHHNDLGQGALHLHMDHLMAQESQAKSTSDLLTPGTPEKWSRLSTITSGETPETAANSNFASPIKGSTPHEEYLSPRKMLPRSHTFEEAPSARQQRREYAHQDSYGFGSVPRAQTMPHGKRASLAEIPSTSSSRDASPARNRLGFTRLDAGESRRTNPSRGDGDSKGPYNAEEHALSRQSIEVSTPMKHKRHLFPLQTNDSANSVDRAPNSSGSARDGDEEVVGTPKEPSSAVRRFFKGGRLGALVRNETSKVGDLLRRRDGSHEAFDYASSGSTELFDEDTDASYNSPLQKSRPSPLKRAPTSGTITESPTKDDLSPRYQNLPTFRRTSAKQDSDLSRPTTPEHDHISVQQDMSRRNRSPRFDGLKPPGLDMGRLSSRETSADGGDRALSRTTTANENSLSRHASHVSTAARPRSPQRTNKLLQAVIDQDLGRGRSASANPPVSSPLPGGPVVSRRETKSAQHQRRQWSISDGGNRAVSRTSSRMRSPLPPDEQDEESHPFISVTKVDIEHVRALLLSSGIRAASLLRLAEEPRPEGPPQFLRESALAAGKTISSKPHHHGSDLEPANSSTLDLAVPRKEEHTVAAQNYSTALTTSTTKIHSLTSDFQQQIIPALTSNLSDLHARLEALMNDTLSYSDTAAAFSAEVTGQRPLEVRKVLDQVERLARVRRRRLRWLRRIGFGAVEWAILGIMWIIWFIVVLIRGMLGVVRGAWRGVRWVLWLD